MIRNMHVEQMGEQNVYKFKKRMESMLRLWSVICIQINLGSYVKYSCHVFPNRRMVNQVIMS